MCIKKYIGSVYDFSDWMNGMFISRAANHLRRREVVVI